MTNKKNKRILFIVPYLSGGGAERIVSNWSSELGEVGFEVHVLVFYGVENEYKINNKVEIHRLAKDKDLYKRMNSLSKVLAIRKVIKTIKPSTVIPFVTYVGLVTNIARLGLGVTLIDTIRNNPWKVPNNRINKAKRNLSVILSDLCIVQNYEQMRYFPKRLQKKMFVVPNSISDDLIKFKKTYSNNKICKVVTLGRLEKQKNHKMLINAFSNIVLEHKDLELHIYGEGSLYNELDDLISQLSLTDKVFLKGRTNNVASALCNSDLFVLSSNYEGMPNALMEAMAIGLPCISTNCPTGPSELISTGEDGLLVPVGNGEAMEKAIRDLINDPLKAIEMGEKARFGIFSNYTNKKSIDKLVKGIKL